MRIYRRSTNEEREFSFQIVRSKVLKELISTKQVGRGIPVLDETNKAADVIRTLSLEDFGDSAIQIAKDGSIKP